MMSVGTVAARRVVTLAASGLVVVGVAAALPTGLPAAQAAPLAPASLHVTGSVTLGKVSTSVTPAFGEAPDGAVYFSFGRKVYLVTGTKAPALRLTASGTVLAVAANATEVFVAVGRTVTAYQRSTGVRLRRWKLASPHPPTSAGLYAIGNTVWAWTDWATDSSGFEFANVSRFSARSATVHKVSYGVAYPVAAADASGLYFETVTAKGTNGYLEHATPAGRTHRARDVNLPGVLALAGGRVEILAAHFSHGKVGFYLDAYTEARLVRAFSRLVTKNYLDVARTAAGLLAIVGCNGSPCSVKVSQLSTATGATIRSVKVADAIAVLAGGQPTVIGYHAATKTYFLVRLAG